MYKHVPVMLGETLNILNPQPGQNFLDCTLGGGGYTAGILERTAPNGKTLAIDLDIEAIENFKHHSRIGKVTGKKKLNTKNRLTLVHGNFRDIDRIINKYEYRNISGIVADLGLSSFQIDSSGRGITFQKKERLDMRFDQKSTQETAGFIINNYEENQLAGILKDYGEEQFARLIARGIIRQREVGEIMYTTDLVQVITASVPSRFRFKANDSVRRVFQALRIVVNGELENLKQLLPKALELLSPGGRLAIVSFHSLEARMVKEFFVKSSKGCVCPPDFPVCICGKSPMAKLLTRKPITASVREVEANPRSKSAELRAIEKI